MRASAACLIGVILCLLFNSVTFWVFHGFSIQKMGRGGILNAAEYAILIVVLSYLSAIVPALIAGIVARNHGWYLGGLCVLTGTVLYVYALPFFLHGELYLTASGEVDVDDAYSISLNIPYLLRGLVVGAVAGHLGQWLVQHKRPDTGTTP